MIDRPHYIDAVERQFGKDTIIILMRYRTLKNLSVASVILEKKLI